MPRLCSNRWFSLHKVLYRALKRTLKLALEAVAAILGIAFVLAMLLVWRANQGPIIIDSIAPQLAQLLSNPVTGIRTEIGHAQITWNREDQALRLVTTSVRVYDGQAHLLAELPQLALGLNFLAPLRGQLAPLEIFSRNFTLRLTRSAQGHLLFGEMPLESPTPADSAVTQADITDIVRQVLQLDSGWFGLGRVGAVRLTNVQLIIADQARKVDWASFQVPSLTVIRRHAALQLRAELRAQIHALAAGDIILEGDYDRHDRALTLLAKFSALNPAAWASALALSSLYGALDSTLNGSATLRLDENAVLQEAAVKLQGGKGAINWPALWEKPLPLDALGLEATLDWQKHTADLREAWFTTNGVRIAANLAAAPATAAQPDKLLVKARAAITDWPLARVAEIWPAAIAPNPRAWIAAHMRDGVFKEVAADVQWQGSWAQPEVMQNVQLDGKISMVKATIDYLAGMPPVTGVDATATADLATMKILVAGGKADHVTLGASPVVITGLDADDQTISINLTGKNSVSDVIRLIDQPPLHYARAVGLKPEQVSGTADLDIKFGFPLLKDLPLKAMQIDARAKIADLASDKLVPGLTISQGNLLLAVDGEKMSVSGKAAYNDIPLETNYEQRFSAPATGTAPQSSATLKGEVTAADIAKFGLPLEGMTAPLPVVLHYEKGFTTPATLNFTADMTPTALKLPMLNWEKAEKAPASAKLAIILEKGAAQLKQLALQGPKLDVQVSGAFANGLQPKSLTCKPCIVGRNDMRAKLDFIDGTLTELALTGAALDYHDASPKQPEAKPKAIRLKLDIGKFYQGGDRFFANVRGTLRRDVIGWDMIDLKAVAEGRVPVAVSLMPQTNGTRKLSITTDDFGDVLRAADVTDQVHEGKLSITGSSTAAEPYRIMGKVDLRNYRVRKLPFLAVLLNAASFTGFADMLGGQGLNFDRLEGGFDWNGQKLGLDDWRTAGGALGLNIEGEIDFAASRANLRGTVVPFSFFNSIVGNIPLVGDLITGGKGGGLVAATYQAKGPLDKLDITVNPVSFLAPGILRRIFFQG